jgi:hypothetical protein
VDNCVTDDLFGRIGKDVHRVHDHDDFPGRKNDDQNGENREGELDLRSAPAIDGTAPPPPVGAARPET